MVIEHIVSGASPVVKVKISVVKRLKAEDVYGKSLPKVTDTFQSQCQRLRDGDEFVSEDGAMPAGFCSWAFADIQRDITHLRFGGDFPWIGEKGVNYACCTDGLRPVIFRLERLKE